MFLPLKEASGSVGVDESEPVIGLPKDGSGTAGGGGGMAGGGGVAINKSLDQALSPPISISARLGESART